MGVEVQSPIATQQAVYGMPARASRLAGHSDAGGEFDKFTREFKFFLEYRELILLFTAPNFLDEEQVGVERK